MLCYGLHNHGKTTDFKIFQQLLTKKDKQQELKVEWKEKSEVDKDS